MNCQKCGEKMNNLGNVSGMVYTSNPLQWDDVYVCHNCKVKKIVRKYGEQEPSYSYLENYKTLTKNRKGM